jgi:hypothetical protein
MGPRSFDRGNTGLPNLLFMIHPLQWGRDLSIAEIEAGRLNTRVKGSLQWGRDLSIAEIKRLARVGQRGLRFNGAAIFRSRK